MNSLSLSLPSIIKCNSFIIITFVALPVQYESHSKGYGDPELAKNSL